MAAKKSHDSGHFDGRPSLERNLSRQARFCSTNSFKTAARIPVTLVRGVHSPSQSRRHKDAPASTAFLHCWDHQPTEVCKAPETYRRVAKRTVQRI